jgi:DNA-binding NtrC family response regulator
LATENGRFIQFSVNALEALLLWNYARNVRELRSICRQLHALGSEEASIHLELLRQVEPKLLLRGSFVPSNAREVVTDLHSRRTHIQELLKQYGGNVSKVAKAMGRNRSQVYRWLNSMGLSVDDYR